MRKINYIIILILLFSCEKSEIPVEKHNMGDIKLGKINMDSDYKKQLFYNLDLNIVVKENLKTDWDLAFESSSDGWHIILNTSTLSESSQLKGYIFEDNISLDGLTWNWDDPKGINNFTAIGDYRGEDYLYIINRGYKINGDEAGYKKIMIDSVNSTGYYIKYSNLDNSDINNIQIKKDTTVNFQYLSFENNSVVDIEPNKEDWDLVFTQYTHLFNDNIETPAYLVTGTLTNYLNDISVAKDSINKFEEITSLNISSYTFSNNQDEIGYKWKTFNFDSQIYTVNSHITYVIKDQLSRYFKLRFLDFYNEDGEKGAPTFEIQEL